ncbi:hypothetical protein ACFL12_05905 [Pseudomonadota bacterium]
MQLFQNTVLTAIALALGVIAFKMDVSPANAQLQISKVQICDDTGRCAKIDPTFEAIWVKDPM